MSVLFQIEGNGHGLKKIARSAHETYVQRLYSDTLLNNSAIHFQTSILMWHSIFEQINSLITPPLAMLHPQTSIIEKIELYVPDKTL
jgi:hypothetical protein